jgi:FMN reductase
MSAPIVFVSGSPSATSRSSAVARVLGARLEARGHATRLYSVRDFDPADLVLARADAPAVKAFVDALKGATAVVLSTPIYKATYSGALKALVDLVPPDALVDKPALGIGTTRSAAHGVELEKAYAALFAFFRARWAGALVALDEEVTLGDGGPATLAAAAEERLASAAEKLARAVEGRGE